MFWKKIGIVQIIATLILVAFLAVSLGYVSENTVKDILGYDLQNELDLISNNLKNIVISNQQSALEAANDEKLQKALKNNDEIELESLEDEFKSIYGFDSVNLVTINSNLSEKHYRKAKELNGPFYLNFIGNGGEKTIRMTKVVFDTSNWTSVLGYISVTIKPQSISTLFSIRNHNDTYAILDENGEFHSNYQLKSELKDIYELNEHEHIKRGFIVTKSHMASNGWTLVSFVPSSYLTQYQYRIESIVALFAVFVIAALTIISVLLNRQGIRISTEIIKYVNDYAETGHILQSDIDESLLKKKGEMGELYRSFLAMTARNEELIEQVYVAEIKKKDAELAALQAQINPHFLYNTLDTINWLADKYDAEDISQIVTNLAKLLRLSLNKGSNITTIDNEINQVVSYMEIQKVRYDDIFEYHIDVPEILLDYPIIKLLLQPLVENAITHGYETTGRVGTIVIRAAEIDNYIEFSVTNDGTEADLKKIDILLNKSPYERTSGYGIKNVQNRLITQYGAECGLKYSIENGKTVVRFKIIKG